MVYFGGFPSNCFTNFAFILSKWLPVRIIPGSSINSLYKQNGQRRFAFPPFIPRHNTFKAKVSTSIG